MDYLYKELQQNGDIDFIILVFLSYQIRKMQNKLYSSDDYIPQNLIMMYFSSNYRIDFKNIISNFKDKYIYNENEIENVYNEYERAGISEVYNYIEEKENDKCLNIYVILIIHQLLYSKVPYKEFGGKFRNSSACISNSDVRTTEPENISKEIAALYDYYQNLLELSLEVNKSLEVNLLMLYIDKVIELKCKLVEIHPFFDGNGRTFRALTNLLFRKVNLPPIYVKKEEKETYINAMDSAIRLNDLSLIRKFYYYKICDSIIELDLSEKVKDDDLIFKVFSI